MRVPKWVPRLFWAHPVFWLVIGIPLFLHLSQLPKHSWNVEILIARNLLHGHGFVVAPLDPPALWRPPLAVFVLLPIEMLFRDPHLIYAVYCTLTLLGLLLSVFYLMKTLGGDLAAHVSQLAILITPAFTVLVSRQLQLMSYLLLFGLVALSILVTLQSWRRVERKWDLLAGVCWGLAFLARPEVVPLFGVGVMVGFIFHRRLGIDRRRAGLRVVLQCATFVAVYVPSTLIFASLQSRHGLVGQEPLVTYYAGARFAENRVDGDPDGEGYMESVSRFGSPEIYDRSLLRFVAAHPEAVAKRVGQNLRNFGALLRSARLINLWDCLALVVLSSVLVLARPPTWPVLPVFAYFSFLLLVSPYFLVFHVDARYPLLFVLVAVLWLLVFGLFLWTRVASHLKTTSLRRWMFIVPTVGLLLLCAHRLGGAVMTARNEVVNLRPWRQLADSFRSHVQNGTPVVGFVSPRRMLMFGGDTLWFSYFSETALPWCGFPDCHLGTFPRDKIYSFQGKAQDYLWIKDERIVWIGLSNEVVAEHVPIDGKGAFSLLHLSPPGSPFRPHDVLVR